MPSLLGNPGVNLNLDTKYSLRKMTSTVRWGKGGVERGGAGRPHGDSSAVITDLLPRQNTTRETTRGSELRADEHIIMRKPQQH